MNRRDALKVFGLAMFPGASPLHSTPHMGWKYSPQARRRFVASYKHPFFSQVDRSIKGSGKGKIIMLHKYLEQCQGNQFVPHMQELGDCVSHGFALAVDILTAVQIHRDSQPEQWIAECATEPLYGGSRVEVGDGVLWGDGSTGFWAAEWLMRWGALLRQEYPGGFDFTTYDPALAKEYGRKGCPDPLEPIAKLHPVKTATLVTSYSEAIDAMANGYPVAICSNVGFGMMSDRWVRDDMGFLRRRGQWGHCMCMTGFDDRASRPGVCIVNSWGDWVRGPTRHDQPRGSFWADKAVADAILRQGDSFALSSYVGYPRVDIPDYILW
jgi:hypothetical protein